MLRSFSLGLGRNRAPSTTVNLQRLTPELSQELLLLMTDLTTSLLAIIILVVIIVTPTQQADMNALGVEFFRVLAIFREILGVDDCYGGGVDLCDELFLLVLAVLLLGFGDFLLGLFLGSGGVLLFDLGGVLLVNFCFRWRGSGGVGGWGDGRCDGCGTFN